MLWSSEELLRSIDAVSLSIPENLGSYLGLTEEEWRKLSKWARRERERVVCESGVSAERDALSSEAYAAWERAREKDDFQIFAPFLAKHLDVARRAAEKCAGITGTTAAVKIKS
jgi:Zn-dependent M32 family carboxypeptidase